MFNGHAFTCERAYNASSPCYCIAKLTEEQTMIKVTIKSNLLSDGSRVYSVWVFDGAINAVSHADALQLAQSIAEAIRAHSNEDARVLGD